MESTNISNYTDEELRQFIRRGVQKFNNKQSTLSIMGSAAFEVLEEIYGFPILNPIDEEYKRLEKLLKEEVLGEID